MILLYQFSSIIESLCHANFEFMYLKYHTGKENPSANNQVGETGKTSGWELALLTEPSNNRSKITPDKELVCLLYLSS